MQTAMILMANTC